jgi:hypothetical protein
MRRPKDSVRQLLRFRGVRKSALDDARMADSLLRELGTRPLPKRYRNAIKSMPTSVHERHTAGAPKTVVADKVGIGKPTTISN